MSSYVGYKVIIHCALVLGHVGYRVVRLTYEYHGYIAYSESINFGWFLQSSVQSDFLTCDNSHVLI